MFRYGLNCKYSFSSFLVASTLVAGPIATALCKKEEQTLQECKSKIQKARSLVEYTMVVQGIPGLSIAVSHNGKTIWKAGFGFSNVETSTDCTGDSVMRIASISKPITAALTANLVENGTLDLDTDIRKYLPDFPSKTFSDEEVFITMRQLLSHSGGIRHYKTSKTKICSIEDPRNNNTEVEEFLSNKHYTSSSDALKIFKDDDLVEKPGTKFSYTTYGYTLAGAVLEAVTGKSFEIMAQNLFLKLGMRNTQLDTNQKLVSQRVSYYRRNDNHILENCPEVDCSYKYAGGGVISNVTDLLIFANAILYSLQSDSYDALIKKETTELLLKNHSNVNQNTGAGLGWFIVSGQKIKSLESRNQSYGSLFYHTGAAVGASSALLIYPGNETLEYPSGVCVAILCNIQNVSVLPLAKSVAELFADQK